MKRGKQISVKRFTGGMNQDSDLHFLGPNQYPYAKNVEIVKTIKGEVVVSMRANSAQTFLYDGQDGFPNFANLEVIGHIRDDEINQVIYFLWDSATSQHHIMHYPDSGNVQRLLKGSFLNFTQFNRIHSGTVIGGNVYFSDGMDFLDSSDPLAEQGGIPTGNPPRCFNIERFRPKKRFEYELLFNSQCFVTGVTFSYQLFDYNNDPLGGSTPFYTIPAPGTQADIMTAIFNALNAGPFEVDPFPINTASFPARRIVFRHSVLEDVRIQINATGTGSPETVVNELNYYPPPETTSDFDEMITVIKPCPPFAPQVKYEKDATLVSSNVYNRSFQFRHRYVFVDGEKSAWGPISQVPTNLGQRPGVYASTLDASFNDKDYNKIVITFDAFEKYLFTPWRTFVRKIELCVRSSESDPWLFVDSYDLSNYFIDQISIDFLGLEAKYVVASDEVADADVQALKNFDFVPKIGLGIESVYDDQGNALLAIGGGLYDYDVDGIRGTATIRTDIALSLLNNLDTEQVSRRKGLKRGGKYRVGILCKDEWGRQSSVIPFIFPGDQNEIKVPFSKFSGGSLISTIPTLETSVLTPFPSWAVYYQVAISKNLNQDMYWQFPTRDVRKFAFSQDFVTDEVVIQEAVNGDYLGFGVFADQIETLPDTVVLFANENDLTAGNTQFIPASGDKLQVMYWDTAGSTFPATGPVEADVEQYNYNIVGYMFYTPNNTDSNIMYILIKSEDAPDFAINPSPTPINGVLYHIEVYRPVIAGVDDLYYEFGDVKRIAENQPTITHTNYGDTYTRLRVVSIPNEIPGAGDVLFDLLRYGESSSLHVDDYVQLGDLGRAVAYDPGYKERYLPNFIRHSDIYVPQSSIRGLSSFAGGNSFSLTTRYGPICKLTMNQNVLLAVMANKTQPIYIAKDRLLTLSGSLVGRTERIFNVADEVMLDLGSRFPSAVYTDQGRTWGHDTLKGKIWRYTTGGGQVVISDYGMARTYRLNRTSFGLGLYAIPFLAFDRGTDTLFAFDGQRLYTFLEDPQNPRWISQVDTSNLTGMIGIGADFLMFDDETPYKFLDLGGVYRTNICGVQRYPEIDVVINDQPGMVKLFDSIEVHANEYQWHSLDIEIPKTVTYPNGMTSQLIANKWKFEEGVAKASFLRDQTDPSFGEIGDPTLREVTALLQGRELRGEVIRIRLICTELAPIDKAINAQELREVFVYWQPSRATILT